MFSLENVPVPVFILNSQLDILQTSSVVRKLFPSQRNFLQLVDIDSKNKVSYFLQSNEKEKFEANLITCDDEIELFELYQTKTHDENLYVVCIPLKDNLKKVSHQVHMLREQLMVTDKDKLEYHHRKEILSLFQPFLNDTDLYHLTSSSDNLKALPNKLEKIEDLLSLIRPDIIESGKSDHYEVIIDELNDLRSSIDFYLTLMPLLDRFD
ncbi:hypothetical protein FS935_15810 [Metabacillus litoralis]|uniref:Uncharacterized protein n=1 Tax=Metabacillus litoralis TaxID=152268 RepID=A0A5C6VWB5_9BACI|nr:hypothetical protein [Metabacillus litoralis]TXC89826.1 hypothetical protein FS935_15810 [Metabacillus litoralis]